RAHALLSASRAAGHTGSPDPQQLKGASMEVPNDPTTDYARRRFRDFGEMDDDVVRAIVNAARYEPNGSDDPQISTSRLFLGALDAADGGGALAALAG